MSFITNANAPVQIGARLSTFVATNFAAYQEVRRRKAVYNQVKGQLSRMSDRDLADIGINRLLIDDVAHEAGYGKAAR